MTDPTLVYDDDCGFCTWAADLIATHGPVRVVGFSGLPDHLRDRLPPEYEECAHFVTEETVYSCGEAAEKAVLHTKWGSEFRPLVNFAQNFGEYQTAREWGYRLVADNRGRLGTIVSMDPPAGE